VGKPNSASEDPDVAPCGEPMGSDTQTICIMGDSKRRAYSRYAFSLALFCIPMYSFSLKKDEEEACVLEVMGYIFRLL